MLQLQEHCHSVHYRSVLSLAPASVGASSANLLDSCRVAASFQAVWHQGLADHYVRTRRSGASSRSRTRSGAPSVPATAPVAVGAIGKASAVASLGTGASTVLSRTCLPDALGLPSRPQSAPAPIQLRSRRPSLQLTTISTLAAAHRTTAPASTSSTCHHCSASESTLQAT